MGAFLRKLQRPAAQRMRVQRPLNRAQLNHRDRGRLFDDEAPNADCRRTRTFLYKWWARICLDFAATLRARKGPNAVLDPQDLLRFLRRARMDERLKWQGSEAMKFLAALNEARAFESKVRASHQKDFHNAI